MSACTCRKRPRCLHLSRSLPNYILHWNPAGHAENTGVGAITRVDRIALYCPENQTTCERRGVATVVNYRTRSKSEPKEVCLLCKQPKVVTCSGRVTPTRKRLNARASYRETFQENQGFYNIDIQLSDSVRSQALHHEHDMVSIYLNGSLDN